jgi:hypothetical protein
LVCRRGSRGKLAYPNFANPEAKNVHFLVAIAGFVVKIRGRTRSVLHANGGIQTRTAEPSNRVNHQLMRILLQKKETGLYLKDVGSWTRASVEAMNFVSSSAAIDFCTVNTLTEVQVVLKFDEQQYDIVLPVMPPNVTATRPVA